MKNITIRKVRNRSVSNMGKKVRKKINNLGIIYLPKEYI